ncbi:MAG: hypothetical protein QNJ44_23405 [Rhodobacter sp.]|nr:hypothetical protein [Rhodobacter sp.]
MTKPLTKAQACRIVRGAIQAAREEGLKIAEIAIGPDGRLILLPETTEFAQGDKKPEEW